jgi:hypothetical protein
LVGKRYYGGMNGGAHYGHLAPSGEGPEAAGAGPLPPELRQVRRWD